MESITYISRKVEIFWKRVKDISNFVSIVSLLVFPLVDNLNPYYWLIPFAFLGLSTIANIPEEYCDKDISEIRKRYLWISVMFAAGMAEYVISLQFFQSKKVLAFVLVSCILVAVFL